MLEELRLLALVHMQKVLVLSLTAILLTQKVLAQRQKMMLLTQKASYLLLKVVIPMVAHTLKVTKPTLKAQLLIARDVIQKQWVIILTPRVVILKQLVTHHIQKDKILLLILILLMRKAIKPKPLVQPLTLKVVQLKQPMKLLMQRVRPL